MQCNPYQIQYGHGYSVYKRYNWGVKSTFFILCNFIGVISSFCCQGNLIRFKLRSFASTWIQYSVREGNCLKMPWIKFDEIEKKEKKVTKKVTGGNKFYSLRHLLHLDKRTRWMNRWHCLNPAHRRKRGCSLDFLYAFASMSENCRYNHGRKGTIGYPVRKQLLPTATLCQCGRNLAQNQRQLKFLPDFRASVEGF